jgi:protocatechuate 3,4-dioxygenase beta subunit
MSDYRPNRRRLIRDTAGAGLGLAGLSLIGSRELLTADEAGAAPACTLSPELTEGPYYLDLERIRKNITEGRGGLRLDLRVTVVNALTCEPIEDVAVDIWHADAGGVYSGIGSEGTTGKTFMRGVQLTGAKGVASFVTVYPGWYQGRATHIHLKTHVGGRAGGSSYSGGHVAHTGQLFFSDTMTDRVAKLSPYSRRTVARTRNRQDNIYSQGGSSALLRLTKRSASSLRKGLVGRITLGIDPDATP